MENLGFGETGEHLSIMIPNYNNAHYIGETLRSLLANGDKIADAQIEVLDNCSTDDSERVVWEVSQGRVKFTRHSENIGVHKNHNECYTQATREWVHILHSDDVVFPNIYTIFDKCLKNAMQQESGTVSKTPDAVFGRCVWGDEHGIWDGVSPFMGSGIFGVLEYSPMVWAICPVHFLSTIVRREAGIALGGYNPEHGAMSDWNFCWRLHRQSPVAYTNEVVGFYRLSPTNETSALVRTGAFSRDGLRQVERVAKTVQEEQNSTPPYGRVDLEKLYDPFFDHVVGECYRFLHDTQIFKSHLAVLRDFPYSGRRQKQIHRLWLVHQKKKLEAIKRR